MIHGVEFFEVPRGKAGMLSSNQKEKVLLSFAGILPKDYTGKERPWEPGDSAHHRDSWGSPVKIFHLPVILWAVILDMTWEGPISFQGPRRLFGHKEWISEQQYDGEV